MSEPRSSPVSNDALDAATVAAQYGMMVRASSAFLPFTLVSYTLITATFYAAVPWWVAYPLPALALLTCALQVWRHKGAASRGDCSQAIKQRLVAEQAWRSVATSVMFGLWSLGICLTAPREAFLIVAALSGITALGAITHATYMYGPMRIVWLATGLPLAIAALVHGDDVSVVVAALYAANALLMERYITRHFDSFRRAVAHRLNSELARAEIARIANTDALTGVANRRALLAAIQALVKDREATGNPFAVGVIDLDGFKPVNDCFGHSAGDSVLVEVARRLEHQIGARGCVARLGGDEFALLIHEAGDHDDILAIGNAAIAALCAPVEVAGTTAQVSASCGFALYPEAGADPAALLEHADEALYLVKGSQRSITAIYDRRRAHDVVRRATLEQRLRRAMHADQLFLEYQPIVCTATGRVLRYEALARWSDEEEGRISPAEFIPIAETCGLIGELSRKLLRQAVNTAATWPADIGLAFNLSASLFTDQTFALTLVTTLEAARMSPSRLMLEITETALARDPEQAIGMLQGLKALGVGVAIDDFGTGYSSFSNLTRLPIDVVKLDRSFIVDCAGNKQQRRIVAGIVDMCKDLGLSCTTEGVETAEQFAFIASIGCDSVQGYHLGRPASARRVAVRHGLATEPATTKVR
jgi:diguanylate cyclase (GGDEF)-like protein